MRGGWRGGCRRYWWGGGDKGQCERRVLELLVGEGGGGVNGNEKCGGENVGGQVG